MSSSIPESMGPTTVSLRDCLIQLNTLVPKTLGDCSKLDKVEKVALSEKIAHILFQVFDNQSNFSVEQRTNLLNIRELAKKAQKMDLLSKPAKKILSKIAEDIKKIGLSLYTSPLDYTIKTKDGDVRVNSDILKNNSRVFKKMLTAGLREQKKETIQLENYSKESVELMIRCLHAPSDQSIVLPSNNAWVLELLDLAMAYGLDDLVKKLELPICKFISAQPSTILDNTQWLDILAQQKSTYPNTTSKLLAEMAPLFLKNSDLPVKPSKIPSKFEIPIKEINSFFNEDTGELLQYLPVVLDIKDAKELKIFANVCTKTKLASHLSIKLSCKVDLSTQEKACITELAKASNIEVSFEELPIPPGTTLFGKVQWETYFGPVGEVPSIPTALIEKLETPCRYFPGKTWKDTHMLVLVPATVDGKNLDLNHLLELVQDPKGGGHAQKISIHRIHKPILQQHGNKAPERSHWVLMSKDVIPDSISKTYEEQQALVAAIPGCGVPDLLTASVAILTHHTHTGVRLFAGGKGNERDTYTRCKETIQLAQKYTYQIVIGGFSSDGLFLNINNFHWHLVGVAASGSSF